MTDTAHDARPIFASADIRVRQVGEIGGGPVVVTFDCYGDWHGRGDAPGFGEAMFARDGVAAIHLQPSGNDWYQYASTAAALAAVRTATAGASRVLAYGSSMGAYAAIRFADRVGATDVLALSPQYSIDPAKVPFERRWLQEGRTIAWRDELDGPIRASVAPLIAYDDKSIDHRHVRLIARDLGATGVRTLRLPFGGHPAGLPLLETRLLQPIVRSMLAGTFDLALTRQAALEGLPLTCAYWCERAKAQPRWLGRRAVGFARRAVAIAPSSPLPHHVLAVSLDRLGRFAESLPIHAHVADVSAREPGYLRPYSFALAAAGDLAAALPIAREIVAADPGRARNHEWEAWLLGELGERDAALAAADRAIAADPSNDRYRRLHAVLAAGEPLRRLHPYKRGYRG